MLGRPIDKYSALSTIRFLTTVHGNSAIRNNNKNAFWNAAEMYDFVNRLIQKDAECAFADSRIPSEPFPEWPEPEMHEEINLDWPVVFSDGSTIDDTADVPF